MSGDEQIGHVEINRGGPETVILRPYFFLQLEDNWERSRYWAKEFYGIEPTPRLLSEYLREHCLQGFLKDPFGVEMRHRIGVDRILWGNDFPHSAGDWPHSRRVIDEIFQGVPAYERSLMLAGNAIQFFHLE